MHRRLPNADHHLDPRAASSLQRRSRMDHRTGIGFTCWIEKQLFALTPLVPIVHGSIVNSKPVHSNSTPNEGSDCREPIQFRALAISRDEPKCILATIGANSDILAGNCIFGRGGLAGLGGRESTRVHREFNGNRDDSNNLGFLFGRRLHRKSL